MVNKDFIKDVLCGQKKLLKMDQLKPVHVPHYDELSIKRLYDDVLKMPDVSSFFPDSYARGRACDRKYFFDVWNTLYQDQVNNLITHANQLRFGLEA